MAYLLDTCALSEFTKPRPSAAVDTWFANLSMGTEYVSVLTLGELEKGIAKLKPSHRRDELERWFVELCARFEGRTLPVDRPVALEWGRLCARMEKAGKARPCD